MTQRTCFVIMPIGDQTVGGIKVAAADLKQRYDDLIKEAILKADDQLEVLRADEVFQPGSITSDILTRIMHADLVVADVTYPNPNVFYELGLRHACRVGTIIIRDKNSSTIPFDIAHLRHIEYENTASGLKQLAEKIRYYITRFNKNPEHPDNQFLELARLTRYRFPEYTESKYDVTAAQIETIEALIRCPDFLDLSKRRSSGEAIDDTEILSALQANPDAASIIVKYLVQSGEVSLNSESKRRRTTGKKRS